MAPRLSERLAAREMEQVQAVIAASANDAATISSSALDTQAEPGNVPPLLTPGSGAPQMTTNNDNVPPTVASIQQNVAGDIEGNLEETGMATENDIGVTTENMNTLEQSIIQTRRANPKRQAALKAVGSYAIKAMTDIDEVSAQVSVKAIVRNSVKRKRAAAFGNTDSVSEDQQVSTNGTSYQQKITSMLSTKQMSSAPDSTKEGDKETNPTHAETKTNLPAIHVLDDGKKDADFSVTTQIPAVEKADGMSHKYTLRGRKEVKYTYEPLEQPTDDTSGGPVTTITGTSKTVVKQENEEDSNGNVSQLLSVAEKKVKKKPFRIPGTFTNEYKIRFGFTPFAEHTTPSAELCHTVFDILREHHSNEVKLERDPDRTDLPSDDVTGPMHAGQDVTFTAILRTVLSQATNNLNALNVEQSLIERFQYNFLGVRVKGETPNYHEIRITPEPVLAKVLAPGGLHIKKAKLIKNCLDIIYAQNMARATPEERIQAETIGESTDFVPGMLSLDYMKSMSTQEKFDHLVSFDGIGVKTAACILCFNFGIPVFAVDTHVYRMAQMLRWVPDGVAKEDHVFMHLDKRVPDELKYGLHQAFWWHGQHCYRCKGSTSKKSKGWDESTCPLEHLIDHDNKIGPRNRGVVRQPRVKDENGDEAGDDDVKLKKRRKPSKLEKNNSIAYAKMKPEVAAEKGYRLRKYPINDAFGTPRSNFMEKDQWCWVLKDE